MGLQQCGLQVWCWLVSTILWLVFVERQLDQTQRWCGGAVLRGGRVTRVRAIPCETSVRSREADLDMGLIRHKYPGSLQLASEQRVIRVAQQKHEKQCS
ncbi:hypothetical protein Taro_042713 [Colocasia esculenta]|uniref:Uncharacterized protein n=1 Tax=Colocasia esculenta TaxID=4460 RepID=A0A843X037_COLES|nr:hypothetical protein [Colocasia esculenta]